MITLLFLLHVIIAALLIIAVLLQSSKGGGLAAGLGGGQATNLLGTRGTATFLSKATTILAILFMVSCIGITLIYNSQDNVGASSVVEQIQNQGQQAPIEQQAPPIMNEGSVENAPAEEVETVPNQTEQKNED